VELILLEIEPIRFRTPLDNISHFTSGCNVLTYNNYTGMRPSDN
jgi:hypothetical protein